MPYNYLAFMFMIKKSNGWSYGNSVISHTTTTTATAAPIFAPPKKCLGYPLELLDIAGQT